MMVQMLDPENNNTRAIFKSVSYPNPGFSASTRIPPEMRKKIVAALLSPEGATATATLRAEFGGRDLVETTGKEYEGLGVLLRDTWGLEL